MLFRALRRGALHRHFCLAFVVALLSSLGAASSYAQIVANGSFETPVLSPNTYQLSPTNATWAFAGTTGQRGISTNGSAFTAQTVSTTDGNQVGFIQGEGTISQAVSISTAGSYVLSVKAIERFENQDNQPGTGIQLGLEVDGTAYFLNYASRTSYTTYSTTNVSLATGSHTVAIHGHNPTGRDNTVFVDLAALTLQQDVPPTISSLTVNPSTGLVAPATVTLTASASDSDGSVTKADFYLDGTFLHTVTGSSPYSWTQSGIGQGTHTASVTVTDNGGATASASQGFSVAASGGTNTIANAGFETPNLGGGYVYNVTGGAWSFVGGTGITGNNNAFTSGNPAAPEGLQVAFIQLAYPSTISQTLNLSTGTFTISFQAAQRGNGNSGTQTVQVLVDGVQIGIYTPPGTSYTAYTTPAFTIISAGSHQLTFSGAGGGGNDFAAFIDNVKLQAAAAVAWTDSWSSDPCIVATTQGATPPVANQTWTGCSTSPQYWLLPGMVQGDSHFTPSCTTDPNAYNCFHATPSASTLEMHGGNNWNVYDTGGEGINLMTATAPTGGKTKTLVLTTSVSPTCSFLSSALQNYCLFALDLYDGESDYRGVYVFMTQYGGYSVYRFDVPGGSDPVQILGYLQKTPNKHGWVYCQSDGSGGCLLNGNAQLTPGTLINLRVEYDGSTDGTTRYYVNDQLVWTDAGATYGRMLNDPRAAMLAGSTGTNKADDPRQYMKAIVGVSTLTAQ